MSTDTVGRSRPRALLALITSFLVAVGGLFALPSAASAASATVVPTVASAEAGELVVRVDASGLPEGITGVYAALIEKGTEAGVGASGGYTAFALPFPAVEGGSSTFDLTATAEGVGDALPLDRNTPYEVLVWTQHTAPNTDTIYARADVIITDDQWNAVFPPETVEPTTTVTTAAASVNADGSIALTATVEPADAEGTVTFSQGDTVLGNSDVAQGSAAFTTEPLSPGSYDFTAAFTPSNAEAFAPSSGAVSATVENEEEEEEEAPTTPATVDVIGETEALSLDGEHTVRVVGKGFLPHPPETTGTRPPLAGKFTGVYIVFGSFADTWQPSEGAETSTRSSVSQKWALPAESIATVGGSAAGAIELDPDGTFDTELRLTADEKKELENGSWGIATYAAGGATYAPFETFTPVTFADPADESEDEDDGDQVATGGLLWSFKSSWNFYLNMIANGTTTVLNGATQGDDGTIGFTQVDGDYDEDTGLGEIQYQGTVRYVSDQHGFDIALANPTVVFAKGGTTLTADVSRTDTSGVSDMTRITVASIEAGAPAEGEDGTLLWAEVAGTFADMIPEGWADYSGQSIDPVTFTYGTSNAEVPTDPTVSLSSSTVKQGDTITFTGNNFEAGERVEATVHSEPLRIGAKTPKAQGAVSFDWTVPADFPTGTHTITLVQGDTEVSESFTVTARSGDVEKVVDLGEECIARAVTGGSMEWGLKSSFRDYVQGRIAKGSFSGGSFSASGGAINTDAGGIGAINFAGSINASGHGGLLQFGLSNPTVQLTGPTSGVLVANVNSTDPTGKPAVSGSVTFATLSFGSVAISGDQLSVSASAALTGSGAEALGGFYSAGEGLDPVNLTVSLGGEVPCDGTTDPAELALTGADSGPQTAAFGLAGLAALVGAGLLLARRRHTAQR